VARKNTRYLLLDLGSIVRTFGILESLRVTALVLADLDVTRTLVRAQMGEFLHTSATAEATRLVNHACALATGNFSLGKDFGLTHFVA
jgi:hypothetical protein